MLCHFVRAKLDCGVNMRFPDGCGGIVVTVGRLGRVLNGVKQATRTWDSHRADA